MLFPGDHLHVLIHVPPFFIPPTVIAHRASDLTENRNVVVNLASTNASLQRTCEWPMQAVVPQLEITMGSFFSMEQSSRFSCPSRSTVTVQDEATLETACGAEGSTLDCSAHYAREDLEGDVVDRASKRSQECMCPQEELTTSGNNVRRRNGHSSYWVRDVHCRGSHHPNKDVLG